MCVTDSNTTRDDAESAFRGCFMMGVHVYTCMFIFQLLKVLFAYQCTLFFSNMPLCNFLSVSPIDSSDMPLEHPKDLTGGHLAALRTFVCTISCAHPAIEEHHRTNRSGFVVCMSCVPTNHKLWARQVPMTQIVGPWFHGMFSRCDDSASVYGSTEFAFHATSCFSRKDDRNDVSDKSPPLLSSHDRYPR